jgi:hypothetical protein
MIRIFFSSFRFMLHLKAITKFILHLILYKINVIPAVVLPFAAENVKSNNEQNISIVITIAFIIALMT